MLLLGALLLAALGLVALWSGGDGAAPTGAADAEGTLGPGAPGGELEGRRAAGPTEPVPVAADGSVRLPPEAIRERIVAELPAKSREALQRRVAVSGSVLDHAGRAVAGARVYQLPQALAAGSAPNLLTPQTTSDGAGRFTLHANAPLTRTFILACLPGGLPGWVHGDEVGPGHTIRLVLPEPTELDVYLVDTEGKALPDAGVRVVPLTSRGIVPPLPGPEAPLPEQFDVTDENGRVRFRFGRAVPLMVIPDLDGWVADPKERWLPDSSGSVSFTVQQGATLVVEALDHETGGRIAQTVWASVLDRASGRELTTGSSVEADGVLRADLPLLPGFYDVLVTVREREPTLIADVHVERAGAVVRVQARMKPLAALAHLSLVLPSREEDTAPAAGSGGPRVQQDRPAVIVFAKRLDGGFERHGWVRRVDGRRDPARRGVLTLPMRPGPYEVIVMDPLTGGVAHMPAIALAPGAGLTRRVTLRPGVQFRLHEVLPPDIHVRDLRVEVADVGTFPAVGYGGFGYASLRSAGGALGALAPAGSARRKAGRGGPTLGPYPGASVVLVVTDWEGGTSRYAVRAR